MTTKTIRQCLLGVSLFALCGVAAAQEAPTQAVAFSIQAQPVDQALKAFADQSGLQLLFHVEGTGISAAVESPGVAGTLTPPEALEKLLGNTGLRYEFINARTVTIRSASRIKEASKPTALMASNGSMRLAQADSGQSPAPVVQEENAQQLNEGRKDGLEEVVVQGAKRKFAPTDSNVATKIPLDIIDTPQALSVVSSELMNMVGIKSISTAAALTPGVVDQEQEIPVFDGVTIRGIEIQATNGYTINGLPIVPRGGPIDTRVADRFEVARGPASVVYGQTSYGGTMNTVLKMPQAKPAIAGGLGYSIDGAYRAVMDMTGALTESGRLRGRLITVYDNLKTPQDLAYQRTTVVAPSLSWDVGENTTLDLNLYHAEANKRRAEGFQLLQREDGSLALPSGIAKSAFLGPDYSRINNSTEDFGIAKLTQRFSDSWVLEGGAGVSKSHYALNLGITGGPISADGEMPLIGLAVVQDVLDKVGDLTLRGDFDAFGRTHTVMLNGSYRRNQRDYIGGCCESLGTINVFDPDPSAFSDPYANFPDTLNDRLSPPAGLGFNWHGIITQRAMSGILLLHPVERLSVMAGLRYSDFKSIGTDFYDHSISYQFPEDFGANGTDKRLGLVYELLKDFNVYASYSTGLIFNTNVQFSGDALPAETGVQWELGAKAALLDRKLTLAAAVFQLDRNNVATGDPNHPNTPYVIGINGQKHKGFELEAIGEPIPGWNLMASYSHLDVKVNFCVEVDGVCTDPFGWNGQQRASAPHDMVKLYTNYQMQGGPLRGVTFGGGVFYVGKREIDNSGTFQVPAYTRFDLRLGYDALENVSFSLNAINVTDEDIYVVQQASNSRALDYLNRRTLMFSVDFKY